VDPGLNRSELAHWSGLIVTDVHPLDQEEDTMLHKTLSRDDVLLGGASDVTDGDQDISAQARSMPDLDAVLDRLSPRGSVPGGGTLIDLGCGMGGLAHYIGRRLGLNDLLGVDIDAERLKAAASRGLRPLLLDLNEDPLPLESGSAHIVTCFGLLAYLSLYDNVLSEASRVLDDDGWFLISMPNLGSYTNRISLLLGYQPHAVAVSRLHQAGKFRGQRGDLVSANMPPLLHGATLRCMRELLDDYGFDVVTVRGFTPWPRKRPVIDSVLSHVPALSRRFLILARKRPLR
jgi:SAM-dependent methyltransferase